MDPNIAFDPEVLTQEDKNDILSHIKAVEDEPDVDGCIPYAEKALKNGRYPAITLKRSVAGLFGPPTKQFNPASLRYSILNNELLLKDSDIRMSHLCGNKLCLNVNHVTLEDMDDNHARRDCHSAKKCTMLHEPPKCIIKTV